jgi:cobalt-zinc-cadmium efflux system protein
MHADHHLDRSISGRFTWAIILTSITLVAEVAGGFWTNSLALLSDAAHVFLDLFALVLSLAAIRLAAVPADDTRTFGWHRAEVFASFINGATVFLMAGGIFVEAIKRIGAPQEVKSLEMLVIAGVGLVMNLVSASALHGHSHDDLNVRSAFLHVVGDAAASVGVIAGGVAMHFTGLYILDPLISLAIGGIILVGALRVLREATHILLEGVPRGMKVERVADDIRAVDGVADVHHLNVWTICSHILALSAHIDLKPEGRGGQSRVLRAIEEMLFARHHISHTTLQVECSRCVAGPLIRQLRHRPRAGRHHHGHGGCGHGHQHDDHDHEE